MKSATQYTDLLDTLRAVETPEGITLDLHIAGPTVRALAWLIDFLIRFAILAASMVALLMLGATGYGLWLLLFFLLEWFYPVAFEVYRDGATPGKRALGIKVVSDNGAPVDFSASLIRNLLRAADFLPFLYGFALLSMLLNRDFKRLGDLAAGTLVIYRRHNDQAPELPAGPSMQPAQPLSAAEQKLIITFTERSSRLNPERQAELAGLLDGLADRNKNAAPLVEQLHAQARWFVGSAS